MIELGFQISSLNTKMHNLRDQMQALTNAVYNNTEYLEEVVASNEGILDEINSP